MKELPFWAQVAGVASMGAVTVRGEEYTPEKLASLIRVNPEIPVAESARTPQLLVELGRLVAAAQYEADIADVEYRQWRDSEILTLMDAEEKVSKTKAESIVRSRVEYMERSKAVALAQEAVATLHAAYEAAKSRTRAIFSYEHQQGGVIRTPDSGASDGFAYAPMNYTDDDTETSKPLSREELRATEERQAQRTVRIPTTPIPVGPPPKKEIK